MKNSMKVAFTCLLGLAIISCGGGSSTPPPPPPPPTLTVSPSSVNVPLGGTQQFTAILSTTGATTATWSINGIQGGNATDGTIDANGFYHAPSSAPSPATFTVTAVASGLTANGTLTVVSPTISVSPNPATVALGAIQQFTATFSTGGQANATWSINGVQGGNATVGTIDSSGKYTAPGTFPTPNTFTVSATSLGITGNGNLTVAYPNNNHTSQTVPIKLGTTGGNATDFVDSGTTRTCCSGTLGSLVSRGGSLFILSNNHVLDKSDQGSPGQNIQQPGLVDNQCDVPGAPPATVVANLTEAPQLKPGAGFSNVDAAIAAINLNVDNTGSILDLGPASPTGIAAAPPSKTLALPANVLSANEGVAKSGRSTGLTCSKLSSVNTSVSVDYDTSCGGAKAFTATFSNQVIINGGSFSASGDSGSLVVTSDTARPVGLLYAGNSTSTTANPIQDVINALSLDAAPFGSGGDHAVSCEPTATTNSASTTVGGGSAASLTVQQKQRATAAQQKYANQLLENRAVADVSTGASADNPQESAVVITVHEPTTVPAMLDGVRTRVVYANGAASRAGVDAIQAAIKIKDAHANRLMAQSGIQGVGVGVSDDNPAEPALVIYTISGAARSEIPAVIDGMRTKIIEGDRFRAFGWGKETVKRGCSLKALPKSPGLPKLP